MVRTKSENGKSEVTDNRLIEFQRVLTDTLTRTQLAYRMGWSYGDDRKIYEALGYPAEEDLNFTWYWNKYQRQDIAATLIDRPVDATWKGQLDILEEGASLEDSVLAQEWKTLDETFQVKERLLQLDKLCGLGQYALLLFGFKDISLKEDWKKPISGGRVGINYLKAISEHHAAIDKWDNDPRSKRYGMPLYYRIQANEVDSNKGVGNVSDLIVHHSRVLHIKEGGLTSDVYGTPRLKAVANRLLDIEKVLGGDAEMFWRGARPGYHMKPEPEYEFTDDEREELETELDKFEHDLRRIITGKGIDIKALTQELADPLNHLDAQLQAISAKTGIPKRILVGSERGELASSQDKDQWLALIKSRKEEFAEKKILRPFVNKCMSHGILRDHSEYNVMWEDVFAPSEKEKAEVGKERAQALKFYSEAVFGQDAFPIVVALKYIFGLNGEQVQEVMLAIEEQVALEDNEPEEPSEPTEE